MYPAPPLPPRALGSREGPGKAAAALADLKRTLDYKATDGKPYSQPLWHLLQHVVNHATHHRSEVATMVTMTKGSPAPTDMVLYYRLPTA